MAYVPLLLNAVCIIYVFMSAVFSNQGYVLLQNNPPDLPRAVPISWNLALIFPTPATILLLVCFGERFWPVPSKNVITMGC